MLATAAFGVFAGTICGIAWAVGGGLFLLFVRNRVHVDRVMYSRTTSKDESGLPR